MSARRERKVVTVLFADLVAFTARAESLDPEDVEAILRPYHERLRQELEQRGGTVEKFVGDAVMAVFGAPLAHEDDPERAVRAALAIRDGIAEDGTLEVRTAVNTGEALVSVDARPELGEGMVAGDVVNTASRLQSAAPANGILVGETTYRATRHVIDYSEHAPVDAKGKAEPVPVWEVVGAKARIGVEMTGPATPLVGRERERDLLLSTFDRVRRESSTQLVTIAGVPGIGKSRLVAELYGELEREAELTNWRRGRALPYGEGGALWAFAEMVKAGRDPRERRRVRGRTEAAGSSREGRSRGRCRVGRGPAAPARRAERGIQRAGGELRCVAAVRRGPRRAAADRARLRRPPLGR
jgi:class 3 adenylate cyclase